MKGIVFTEFLEMVEESFGFELADRIVVDSKLPSGGVYTAVGTYSHAEMFDLIHKLSEETQLSPGELQKIYGKHLFSRFSELYGHFFQGMEDAFSFLEGIENYIHVEVRKLYPDAELPSFEIERHDPDTLHMTYRSERGMADFAHGLIEGCLKHFGENARVDRRDQDPKMTHSTFILSRVSD